MGMGSMNGCGGVTEIIFQWEMSGWHLKLNNQKVAISFTMLFRAIGVNNKNSNLEEMRVDFSKLVQMLMYLWIKSGQYLKDDGKVMMLAWKGQQNDLVVK